MDFSEGEDDCGEEADGENALGAALDYFADRMNRVFAPFFADLEFRDGVCRGGDSEFYQFFCSSTIRSACLHASLISLRDLDDFLGLKK